MDDDTWQKLHDLGSEDLQLKSFNKKEDSGIQQLCTTFTQVAQNSFSSEVSSKNDNFKNVDQVKLAITHLIECQQAIWPENKSIVILNYFFQRRSNLAGDVFQKLGTNSDKVQTKLLEHFTNIILRENGIKYKADEDLHDTNSITVRFNSFMNDIATTELIDLARKQELEEEKEKEKVKEFLNSSSSPLFSPSSNRYKQQKNKTTYTPAQKELYNSICKLYNRGNCTRMDSLDKKINSCRLNPTTTTQHICNAKKYETGTALCLGHHPATQHPKKPK